MEISIIFFVVTQASEGLLFVRSAHQFVPVLPPVPLGIVFGEALIDDTWAWPPFRRAGFETGLIFERTLATHRALGGVRHVWPSIGVVLLDHAGCPKQLDGLLEHLFTKLWWRILLGEYAVDELKLVRTLRHIGVQRHGADHAAIRLRDINEAKQNVREHASYLRRHTGQHLELIFTEVTRQRLDHV